MQWSRTTKGDQREIPRVKALLHRDQTQCSEHIFVDDVDDPLRSILDRQSHGLSDGTDGLLSTTIIKIHIATEFCTRRQVAQNHIGIGHRRLGTSLGIGCRTRLSTGALWADSQRLGQFRNVGDRSSTRTDSTNVYRRRAHGHVCNSGLASRLRHPVLNQGNVGRGAAHVKGQKVFVSGLPGHPLCT